MTEPWSEDDGTEHAGSGFQFDRAERYRALSVGMRAALAVVTVLAALAVVLPEKSGERVGGALVVVLVAAPLLRVGWFVVRWFRRGDPRFALVGLGVLGVVAAGALLV